MSAFFTTGVVAMTATSAGDRFTGTVSFTRTDLQTGFFLTVVHRFTKANPFGARAAEAPAGAHAVKTENVIIRAPVTLFVLAVLQPSARSRFMEPFFHQCHHQTSCAKTEFEYPGEVLLRDCKGVQRLCNRASYRSGVRPRVQAVGRVRSPLGTTSEPT
jgi:hypothetical protein